MIFKKYQKAFSLVELSMVILIIGILIAGVSQGIDLYEDFRINTAKTLTLNSINVIMPITYHFINHTFKSISWFPV